MSLPKFFISGAFATYQTFLRTQFGYACKFQPTCSCYAHEAFLKHNPLKALLLTTWRILKCHPFGAGGFDPVPEKQQEVQYG